MTHAALSRERNIFIVGFVLLVIPATTARIFLAFSPPDVAAQLEGPAMFATLASKAILVYLVFRLSKFLRNPTWQTVLYSILAPFAGLYLIPLVSLLVGVKRARAGATLLEATVVRNEEDLDTLLRQLASTDSRVRECAAAKLGARGRAAQQGLAALEQALHDKDRKVRSRAQWAIESIKASQSV